jgi:hypothetical protein
MKSATCAQLDQGEVSPICVAVCGGDMVPVDAGATDARGTPSDARAAGDVAASAGCTPTPEICDGIDNNCDGRIDEIDCAHRVSCGLFDEAYRYPVGPTGTIYPNTMLMRLCTPDGTALGTCRKFFGRCETRVAADGHKHEVRFAIFGEAGVGHYASDAISTNGTDFCVGEGAQAMCRRYFGKATTTEAQGHTHVVQCEIFNDGDREIAGPFDALFLSGGQVCGQAPAGRVCRKWFGRCVAR